MNKNFDFLGHACVRFKFGELIVYTDPYLIEEKVNDADVIFITHGHYDHYSIEDIEKLVKEDTVIVLPASIDAKELINTFSVVKVDQDSKYECKGIKYETVAAYNLNKPFHPKEAGGVGYILEFENVRYYIAGDTDITQENRNLKCDVAFVPVGGTYTMDYKEAAQLVNELKPRMTVPIHYGKVVGAMKDADEFEKLVNKDIKVCRK